MARYSKWPEELNNLDIFTPFHRACVNLEPNSVEKFLKSRKANVSEPLNYRGCYNFTPLHMVIHIDPKEKTSERIKVIKILIWYGGDLDAKDVNGNTPLHIAAMNTVSRLAVFQIFIRSKADTTAQNNFGKSAFDILMSHEVKWKDLELILQKSPLDFDPCNGKSMVGRFLSCDIDFSSSNLKTLFSNQIIESSKLQNHSDNNRNALHNIILLTDVVDDIPISSSEEERRRRQAKLDYPAIVEGLINKGFNVNYQDELGKTALNFAVHFHNFEAVEALVHCGADIQIVDKVGISPLSMSRNFFFNRDQFSPVTKEIIKLIHLSFVRILSS